MSRYVKLNPRQYHMTVTWPDVFGTQGCFKNPESVIKTNQPKKAMAAEQVVYPNDPLETA